MWAIGGLRLVAGVSDLLQALLTMGCRQGGGGGSKVLN